MIYILGTIMALLFILGLYYIITPEIKAEAYHDNVLDLYFIKVTGGYVQENAGNRYHKVSSIKHATHYTSKEHCKRTIKEYKRVTRKYKHK